VRLLLPVGVSAAMVLFGCDAAPERDSLLTAVRDSAGVEILEHTGTDEVTAPWRIRSRPEFRTGWFDDEPTFEYLIQARIEDDGRIVVVDANAPRIYLLDMEGTVLQELGRSGDGPGEFGGTVDAALTGPGDTIIAQDSYGLAIFDAEGVVSDRRSETAWRQGRTGMNLHSRLSDGSLLMVPFSWSPTYGERMWVQAPVGTLSLEDLSLDTLFTMDFALQHPRGEDDAAPHGGMAAGRGARIAAGRSDRAELRMYDQRGTLERIVRWDRDESELTEAEFEVLAEAMRGMSSPELDAALIEQMIERRRAAWRGIRPAYVHLLVDDAGNAWLFEWIPGTAAHERGWIIGDDGSWLGSFELPRRGRVMDVTDSHLLVLEEDEYDVQAVALYEIAKPDR